MTTPVNPSIIRNEQREHVVWKQTLSLMNFEDLECIKKTLKKISVPKSSTNTAQLINKNWLDIYDV